MSAYPNTLIYGQTSGGDNVPVLVDTDGKMVVSPSVGTQLTVLTADPASPTDDTAWVRRTGTSPTMSVQLRVRIAGTTYTIAGITV